MTTSVSVIVVTYNSQGCVQACLDSLKSQQASPGEIVVIDNASTDDTLQIVRKNSFITGLIENKTNRGFGAAVNQGISRAQGEYLLVLNSDVVLESDFLKNLDSEVQTFPSRRIGMIAPLIFDTGGRIDSAGLYLTFLRRFYDRGRGAREDGRFHSAGFVFGACGACAVYKREMLEDIKIEGEYFDEDFFLCVEDVDAAWRAHALGWQAWYAPKLRCAHQGGISRKRSKEGQCCAFRNRYFLLIKNESSRGAVRFFLFCWIYDVPRLFLLLLTNPRIFQALGEIRRLWPRMIEKRRAIAKKHIQI